MLLLILIFNLGVYLLLSFTSCCQELILFVGKHVKRNEVGKIENIIHRQQETKENDKTEKDRNRKRRYKSRLSNDAREKVKDYDRNRKRQVRKSEYNVVVDGFSVSNENGYKEEGCKIKTSSSFESSAKKVVKETIQSPNKKEILVKYFEEKGFHVDLDAVEKKKFSVLQLKSFKLQNRAADHRKLVQDIVDHYGSISKAAKCLNVYYSTFYNLCQPIKQKVHRKTEKRICNESTIKEFFDLKSTTTSFPQARLANKQYMNATYEEAYFKYVDWCQDNGYPAVSNKTFHRLKPENVYKLSDTPENMCVCMLCQNFKKDREFIDRHNIKGVGKHSNEIMLQSMCSVTDADVRNGVLRVTIVLLEIAQCVAIE